MYQDFFQPKYQVHKTRPFLSCWSLIHSLQMIRLFASPICILYSNKVNMIGTVLELFCCKWCIFFCLLLRFSLIPEIAHFSYWTDRSTMDWWWWVFRGVHLLICMHFRKLLKQHLWETEFETLSHCDPQNPNTNLQWGYIIALTPSWSTHWCIRNFLYWTADMDLCIWMN